MMSEKKWFPGNNKDAVIIILLSLKSALNSELGKSLEQRLNILQKKYFA